MKRTRRIRLYAVLMMYLSGILFAAAPAQAESGDPGNAAGVFRTGGTVFFGRFEQDNDETWGPEAIEWTVLDVRDGKALLLSRYGIDVQHYNYIIDRNPRVRVSEQQREKDAAVTWERCGLREWLNGEFYKTAFSARERRAVLKTKVSNDESQGMPDYDTSGGRDTEDYVFLLSYHEAFEQYLPDAADRTAEPSASALSRNAGTREDTASGRITGCWWLRSPGSRQSRASVVDYSGLPDNEKADEYGILVRPAVWVDAGTGFFSAEGRRTCPKCGAPGSLNYCPVCGAPNPEGEPAAGTETAEEPAPAEAAVQPVLDEGVITERYGPADEKLGPVYTPGDPRPMNAVIVARESAAVSAGSSLIRFRDLTGGERTKAENYLAGLAELIGEKSSGLIRFVSDPDRAELLITVNQTYDFYKNYQPVSGGKEVPGYSCKISVEAVYLPDPSRHASFSLKEDPPYMKSVPAGTEWIAADRPKAEDREKVSSFTDSVLRMYGYCPDGMTDDRTGTQGVLRAQRELKKRGFFTGEPDGEYNERTEAAVRALQEARGLPVSGSLDRATMAALYRPADFRPEEWSGGDAGTENLFACGDCGRIYNRLLGYKYCPHCGKGFMPDNRNAAGVKNGTLVYFGRYEQNNNLTDGPEPVVWTVADGRDGMVLLLSRYGLDTAQYDADRKNCEWDQSGIRAWLNGEFFENTFSEAEREAAVLTTVKNGADQGNPKWKTDGEVPDTEDRIFLLSWKEAQETLLTDNADRMCRHTEYAKWRGAGSYDTDKCEWWLRSRGNSGGNSAIVNRGGGGMEKSTDSDGVCIRPAVWVRTDAEIFRDGLTEYRPPEPEGTVTAELPDVRPGNRTVFGRFEQDGDKENGMEPIEWTVLEVREDRALLISVYGLYGYGNADGDTVWEKISLRKWLNGIFMEAAFSAEEQSAILTTEVDNSREQSNPNWKYQKSRNTQDRVFALSWAEVQRYMPHPSQRICAPTEYAAARRVNRSKEILTADGKPAGAWWMRSLGSGGDEVVTAEGEFQSKLISTSSYSMFSVRPVIWVDLTSPVFGAE